jgi:hypothetical protein
MLLESAAAQLVRVFQQALPIRHPILSPGTEILLDGRLGLTDIQGPTMLLF